MQKFELGELLCTCGVADRCDEDPIFLSFVRGALLKYQNSDWGNTCKADSLANDHAVDTGEERILASYIREDTGEKIWIITEWDRSATTILFPEEY